MNRSGKNTFSSPLSCFNSSSKYCSLPFILLLAAFILCCFIFSLTNNNSSYHLYSNGRDGVHPTSFTAAYISSNHACTTTATNNDASVHHHSNNSVSKHTSSLDNVPWDSNHNHNENLPDRRPGQTSAAAAHFCAKSNLDDEHNQQKRSCDLTKGKWIRHENPPPYTTHTCSYIHNSNQNCFKNGRQDTDFLQWRWKPSSCELPTFDPHLFLELMRNKKILIVGDSMARNHMESLLCTLAQVEDPAKEDKYWMFRGLVNFTWPSYNFTLGGVWAPYLVKTEGGDPSGRQQIASNLHLDTPHELWASVLHLYDIAVFSGAYWLMRTNNYLMNGVPVPSHHLLPPESPSQLDPQFYSKIRAMEIIWRTVYRHLLTHFSGVAVIRTLSISHFENSTWRDRGSCNRTRPYSDSESQDVSLDWQQRMLYSLQMRAFKEAEAGAMATTMTMTMKKKLKLKLMDVTYSSLLRPDGHPALHRVQNSPDEGIFDCLHWCQPGPVDTWNQLLLADPDIVCPSIL